MAHTRLHPLKKLSVVVLAAGLGAAAWAAYAAAPADDGPFAGAPDAGNDSSGLINAALDSPVEIQFDTVLPAALEEIAQKTGVAVEASPHVWQLLPWGEQTNLNVTIKNQTLRSALDSICRKLGLEYVLREHSVELQPVPALRRLGRRATMEELRILDVLSSTPLGLQTNRPTVRQLVDKIDDNLVKQKTGFNVEYDPRDAVKDGEEVGVPRNATMAQALESLARDTAVTWYPWGRTVVVLPKEDQIRAQLESRTVTVRYPGVDVGQVLLDLERRAGVDFSIEAGAIQRIRPDFRTVNLLLENMSVRDALDTLSGFTGLSYVVDSKGVSIYNTAPGAGGAGGPQDPAVGMILLDNGVQMLLRESQVPADVREYLRDRARREVDKLKEMMKEEGWEPAQTPQTQPARGGRTVPREEREPGESPEEPAPREGDEGDDGRGRDL